jgi:hypothetical protein
VNVTGSNDQVKRGTGIGLGNNAVAYVSGTNDTVVAGNQSNITVSDTVVTGDQSTVAVTGDQNFVVSGQ